MTSRADCRRKRAKTVQETHIDEVDRPKDAPGVVIKREMIAQVGSGRKTTKRYRNIAHTPLALAYHRGALVDDAEAAWVKHPQGVQPAITAKDRYDCGSKFERLWYERMGATYSDSSIPRIPGGGSRGIRSMTELQQEAMEEVETIRGRMGERNFLIIENLCGFGHSLPDALRIAGVACHPVGTAYRIREALDDLVCAMTGRRLVPLAIRK